MDLGISRKIVLVSGAGANLGRELALTFSREGANLALCGQYDEAGLAETRKLVEANGVKAVSALLNIADSGAVRKFVTHIEETLGTVDVLVNNAVRRASSGEAWSAEGYEAAFAASVVGPFNLCAATVPRMKDQGWGRILTFAGIGAFLGHGAVRASSKMATVGFTRWLAAELGPFGVTANCIAPGVMETQRSQPLSEACLKDEARRSIPRRGSPSEVAALAAFLSSDQASYITGQCVHINGGAYYA